MFFYRLRYIAWKYPFVKMALIPFQISRNFIIKKRHSSHELIIGNFRDLMVTDPVLKVDEYMGKFAMSVNGTIFRRLVVERKYEPEISALCVKYLQHNRDVIDIGANIGFFSVLFAKTLQNGKVISIEPIKNALKYLYHNLELNGVSDKVEVYEGVASDINGELEIKTIGDNEEYSSLGVMKHPSIINKEFVTQITVSTTIDSLVSKKLLNPGFIKMDVEGVEHLVLKGSSRVLKEYRPIILSELSDYLLKQNGSSAKEVIDLLSEYGYEVFDPFDPDIEAGWKKFGDIICFPREMGIKMNSLKHRNS